MNECEQIHPLLRGYLDDSLSARERRLVARHLNLCASARKELDRLKGGGLKSPVTQANPPSEPWDLKVLRWMFKTKRTTSSKTVTEAAKKHSPVKQAPEAPSGGPRRSAPWKLILGIIVFFVVFGLITRFVENRDGNSFLQKAQNWLNKNGIHVFGTSSSLDLVQDLTEFPHWIGNDAPVYVPVKEVPYRDFIYDNDHLLAYWQVLQLGAAVPKIDFEKNALIVVFMGTKTTSGYAMKFKVAKNFSDKTVLAYDEITPVGSDASPILTRPWVLQVIPKPTQQPVLIQKIQ